METLLFWGGSAAIVAAVGWMILCGGRDLGLWRLPARPDTPAPAGALGRREALAWAAGALACQWAVVLAAYCLVHGGPAGFWAGLWQRFTTAGDSPHYLFLAENGYPRTGEQSNLLVFYPLYPLLVRLLGMVCGGRYALCGMVLSQASFAGAAVLFRALAGRRLPAGGARCAAAALLLYPFSFFAFGVYTEGLFLLLSIGCLYALDRQSWTFTPDAAYFAMPVDTLTVPAGLCKVEAIPDDLWAARQNEQAIEYGGKTYAAGDAAEEIGSVSTLYTPADAASCVATFAAGESLGLVYVTTDNIVKADLVDAAGSCTASVELLTLAEGQHVENCFRYPQQRASDVAFELSYCTEAERQNAQYKNLLCLLRVEDGAPTALIRRPQEDDSDGYLRYIDLSDDGTRLLTVRTNTSELRYTRRGYTQTMIIIGPYGVAVAPAEAGEPLYTGLLDAGQDTGQIDQLAEHSGDVMLYTPAIELEPKAQVVIPDLAASEPDSTQTPKEETP